jgi:hypothetical protein
MYANNVDEAISHGGEIANLSITSTKKEIEVLFIGINSDCKNSEKIRTKCGLTGYSFENRKIFHLYDAAF